MNNSKTYSDLLEVPFLKYRWLTLILGVILLLIILASLFSSYDTYYTYGTYQNNSFYIDIPIDNSDAIKNGYFLKTPKETYEYDIKEVSELKNYNDVNYQTYIISFPSKEKYINNEIEKITFYYKKQRIIVKIFNVIL